MEPKLYDILQEGDILNMSTTSRIGGMIRDVLGDSYVRLSGGFEEAITCPNHDAPVVKYDGRLWIGECVVWKRCQLGCVYQYEHDLQAGNIYALRVLRPPNLTPEEAAAMSKYWMDNIQGHPYDVLAFPRLLARSYLGEILPCAAGLEWAHWCTESCMLMLRDGAKRNIYQNNSPTPLTTYKRTLEEKFQYVAYFRGAVNGQQSIRRMP